MKHRDRVSFVNRVGVAPGTTTLVIGPTNTLGALCAKDPWLPYITPPFSTGARPLPGYVPVPDDRPTGFLDPYGTDSTMRGMLRGAKASWTIGEVVLLIGAGFLATRLI